MTRNTLAVLAALTSLALAAPAAADPFEVSKQRCIENGWMNSGCATTTELTGEFPIGEFIRQMNSTMERFREKNGWGDEVTPETIVPVGATFAFG